MTPTINKVLDNSSNSGAHSCCYSVGQWRYRYIPTTNTTGFQHNVKTNRRRRLRKVTKPSSPIIQKNLKKVQRNGYICNGRGRGYAAFRTNYASRGSSRGRGYSGSRGSSKGNGIRTTGRYHGPPALSTGYQRYRSFRARGGHPSQRMSATSSSVPRKNDESDGSSSEDELTDSPSIRCTFGVTKRGSQPPKPTTSVPDKSNEQDEKETELTDTYDDEGCYCPPSFNAIIADMARQPPMRTYAPSIRRPKAIAPGSHHSYLTFSAVKHNPPPKPATSAPRKSDETITVKIANWTYTVMKTTQRFGTQTNVQTLRKRRIRTVHDTIESELSKQLKQTHLTKQLILKPSDDLYQEIANKFYGDIYDLVSIIEIKRIQNTFVFQMYQALRLAHKNNIGESNLNEAFLWHGTDRKAMKSICATGFLRDYGSIMIYGKGVYFATSAQTSLEYSPCDASGYRYMLLCRVLCGESCVGQEEYKVPPFKTNSLVQYESMVDTLHEPNIYVISKDYQVYPSFLITFK
eukprot:706465_1